MSLTYHCEEHDKDYKGPNSKGFYWHVINYANEEYCRKTIAQLEEENIPINEDEKDEEMVKTLNAEKKPDTTETREPIIEPKVDWDAKDRQSIAQTAMKSASEIVAAMITGRSNLVKFDIQEVRDEVKKTANSFYKEMLKMKHEKPKIDTEESQSESVG